MFFAFVLGTPGSMPYVKDHPLYVLLVLPTQMQPGGQTKAPVSREYLNSEGPLSGSTAAPTEE